MNSFWSSGKLLLCGEYWVLHGATALAVPTVLGQGLEFTESNEPLHWTAYDRTGTAWLDVPAFQDPHVGALLRAALDLGGRVPPSGHAVTHLEFDRNWGWGSSSSLTDLMAQWTGVDPMQLHFATSSGSGFDVACARARTAIAYHKTGQKTAAWSAVSAAHWPVDHFALVYLGAKQDSQLEVQRTRPNPSEAELEAMSAVSRSLAAASEVGTWIDGIREAEARTSRWIGQPKIQDRFPNVGATLKSLGAWGGDFALAVAEDPGELAYFTEHGYLCLKWSDCVPPLP
jgi:mevalonate kinase